MDKNIQSEFFESCKKDSVDKIKLFIGKVDLEIRNERGLSPLSILAERGKIDAIEALLNAGAEPSHESLLMGVMCITGGRLTEEIIIHLVRLYSSRGFDINSRKEDGRTILHEAAYYDLPLVVEELIRLGSDLSLKTKKWEATPLEEAKSSASPKAQKILEKYVS
jgi:ankyrin repeat protein